MTGFKTVVADPPWAYRNKNTGGSLMSGSGAKYPTMDILEIANMPVHEIADPKGSMLFLWATVPLLRDCMFVLDSWGFQYKTALFWDKQNYGLGYWWRGTMEMCLVGMRGHVKAYRDQRVNLIREKAREHSRKPVEFWHLIEMHAETPRVELFCRGMPRYGWVGWGVDCARDASIVELDDYMQGLAMEAIIAKEEREAQEDTPAPPYESPIPKANLDEMTDEIERAPGLGGMD